jgi:phage terminase large subunit-like protein
MPAAAEDIRVKIRLHPKQAEFRRSPARYRGFVGGRGAGKSWVGAYDLLRRLQFGAAYLIGSPTGVLMQDTTYPTFKKLAQDLGMWGSVKLTPYPTATLLLTDAAGRDGTAEVRFRTAEDPEKMRGPNLRGAWLDEASLMHEEVRKIVYGSLRSDGHLGWLSATFTPKGRSHWTFAAFGAGLPNTAMVKAATRENPFNHADFEQTLREQYGDSPFARQELEGDFVQVEGAVFPADWFGPDMMLPAWPEGVTHSVLYLDPSQGKDAKSGDDQAFVRAGYWPGPNRENLIVLDCHAEKLPPPDMVAAALRLLRARRADLFGFEVNGTLGLLEAEVLRQFAEARLLARTWPVTNTDPKRWRIKNALMPYLAGRRVRIVDSPGGRKLKAQLMDEPHAPHDDCADAAAGAITLLEGLVT